MKYLIKESQYVYLLENLEKNKKFLTKLLGKDLIDTIQVITSPNNLPIGFLKHFGASTIQQYIDKNGPFYYFVLYGEPFLYKDKGDYELYLNDKGKIFDDGEITERLGLSDMGFKFSDVVNTIFDEEEDDVITEDEDKVLRNRIQRRLGTIDQYIGELDPNDVCDYWTESEVDYYVISSMQNVVEKICDEIGSYDLYNEIYEYISNQGYKSYFRDFFFDTINNYCSK
jgi:hypothetical protein